jgi:hypothetical protein
VQVGFVIGCLASAVFGLADRSTRAGSLPSHRDRCRGATCCCWRGPGSIAALALRVVTGICMAGSIRSA